MLQQLIAFHSQSEFQEQVLLGSPTIVEIERFFETISVERTGAIEGNGAEQGGIGSLLDNGGAAHVLVVAQS